MPDADLIVELQGSGRVACELLRLNDPDHLARFRLMQQMPGFLDRAFAALHGRWLWRLDCSAHERQLGGGAERLERRAPMPALPIQGRG